MFVGVVVAKSLIASHVDPCFVHRCFSHGVQRYEDGGFGALVVREPRVSGHRLGEGALEDVRGYVPDLARDVEWAFE